MATLTERVAGALYGLAIGDAMGAPVEGWPPERIAARFPAHTLETFLPVTHRGDPAGGKGDGRITDDTLMVEALIRAYLARRGHLDAYDYEQYMLPEIAATKVWLPEFQREMAILDRLFWPEKYPWIRLAINHAEPRHAGIGNRVNCGVAMYMLPIGAVNAGDPAAAYQEAASFGLAHNESFAVEAGAVMAAACAAAFAADATIGSVLQSAQELARDGTANAIRDALAAVDPAAPLPDFIHRVRAAIAPYDQATAHVSDDAPLQPIGVNDVGRPSRLCSIEELPAALAALKYGGGDFLRTMRAAVFYGRDCDSIAGMAGALLGALVGAGGIPGNLRLASDQANRRDWGQLAARFAQLIVEIAAQDQQRLAMRQQAITDPKGLGDL
jgi:ADP-ribosylglycohydrolase